MELREYLSCELVEGGLQSKQRLSPPASISPDQDLMSEYRVCTEESVEGVVE